MKFYFYFFIITSSFCISSCVTTTNIRYNDPNYLSSNEFSTYEDINSNEDSFEKNNQDSTIAYENYSYDDYYDYTFLLE